MLVFGLVDLRVRLLVILGWCSLYGLGFPGTSSFGFEGMLCDYDVRCGFMSVRFADTHGFWLFVGFGVFVDV